MTEPQLRAIVQALRWQPSGRRRSGRRGRPHATYDAAELLRLHAALVPWLHLSVHNVPETSCPDTGRGLTSCRKADPRP